MKDFEKEKQAQLIYFSDPILQAFDCCESHSPLQSLLFFFSPLLPTCFFTFPSSEVKRCSSDLFSSTTSDQIQAGSSLLNNSAQLHNSTLQSGMARGIMSSSKSSSSLNKAKPKREAKMFSSCDACKLRKVSTQTDSRFQEREIASFHES